MIDTIKNLYSNTLGTSSATLYTVPVATKTIVTEVMISNKTSLAAVATLTYGGKSFLTGKSVPANDSLIIKTNTILETGTIIAGFAGTASAIDGYPESRNV
jgi:hypothetical protein